MKCRIPAFCIVLAAAACAPSDGRYPSLLPRAGEAAGFAEPERPIVRATPDAALDARIAELIARAAAAHERFTADARTAEARIAVARGTEPGSEVWLEAQAALGDVDQARADTLSALVALEERALERGRAGEPAYPALDAAIAEVKQANADQEARQTALEKALAD